MDAATLQEVERKLINIRSLAGGTDEWLRYKATTLPEQLDPAKEVLIEQGFDAGYRAATDRVRVMLGELKTVALRATR